MLECHMVYPGNLNVNKYLDSLIGDTIVTESADGKKAFHGWKIRAQRLNLMWIIILIYFFYQRLIEQT